MKHRGLKNNVFPLWQFLKEHYGFEKAFNLFGPYKGAGIHIEYDLADPYTVKSYMDLEFSNTNYVGTHFGGSLYSMCDPFFMFILMQNLGNGYIVWDRRAEIEFLRPGVGRVTAVFHIPRDEIDEVINIIANRRKINRQYTVEIKDESEMAVARVVKTLYIRKIRVPGTK